MSPLIEVDPNPALVDDDVVITVRNLDRSAPVTLRAALQDDNGLTWSSWATFEIGQGSEVSTSTSAPIEGTYREIQAEGLLWSMVPTSPQAAMDHALKHGLDPTVVKLTAEQRGTLVAQSELQLTWIRPAVVSQEVQGDGIIGTAFAPEAGGPFRPVLVFGGSDGGLRLETAALLASRGFFALALAYFHYPELPEALVNIPLEYFERAINWLKRDPRSQADRGVAVVGRSRGGELALVLGATFDQVDAVVAYVPSGIVHAGIEAGGASWQVDVPSWTLGGRPLDYLGHQAAVLAPEELPSPIALTPLYCRDLANWARVRSAAIPVENSRGPILMLSGVDDAMWPSSLLSELAVARLAESGYPHPYRHLAFPDAGHRFVFPTLPGTVTSGRHPTDRQVYQYGGTPLGNALAARAAHHAMIGWLRGETDVKAP